MKTQSKFNRKRVTGMIACLAVYSLAVWWLSYQEDRLMVFGLLLISAITTVLSIWLAWRPYKIIALLVAASMIFYPISGKSQDSGTNKEPVLLEGLAVAVLVGVGIVLVVGIVHIAKRIPKNPPADPDDPPRTNSVPRTNAPPVGKKVTMNLSDSQLSIWDCSTNQLANTDQQGNAYQRWFHGRIESSRDLINWSNVCLIHAWASDNNLCLVTYDQSGSPYSTNFCPVVNGTNFLALPYLHADPQAMYFRLRDE